MAAIKLGQLAGLATVPGGGGSPAEGEVGVAVARPLGEQGALERVTGGPGHLWHGSVSMACKEGNRKESWEYRGLLSISRTYRLWLRIKSWTGPIKLRLSLNPVVFYSFIKVLKQKMYPHK